MKRIQALSLSLLIGVLFFISACGDSSLAASQSGQTAQAPAPKPACTSSVTVNPNLSTTPVAQSSVDQHMHMGPHMRMTHSRPVTAYAMAYAQAVINNARNCFAKYKDYHQALKDGYFIFQEDVSQDVYHFASTRNFSEAQTTFDLTHPTALLYNKVGDGYQLVGIMYSAPANYTEDQLDARFPLSLAPWHLHTNICLPAGDDAQALFPGNTPFGLSGTISTPAQCSRVGGTFYNQLFGWMVHIYLWGS